MITVANRIPVTPGREKEFERRLENRAGLVEGHPGFVRNEILKPLEGGYYVIKTYWETMENFEAWVQSEDFKKAHANRPDPGLFSGPNQLEIHEVLQVAFPKVGP